VGENRRTDPGVLPETPRMLPPSPSPSPATLMTVFAAAAATTATPIR